MKENREFIFKDIEEDDFDFDKAWIVINIDPDNKAITYSYPDNNYSLTFEDQYSQETFDKKAKEFYEQRKKIINDRKQQVAQGNITKKEATAPIVVTEKFDKETFYYPIGEEREIEYFF